MRIALFLSILIATVAQQDNVAAETVDTLVPRLRKTMQSVEMAHRVIAQEIAAATPEQREQLMTAIRFIIEEAFKTPLQARSRDDTGLIAGFSSVLEMVSDEDATLAAFGSRLTEVGFDAEESVMSALVRCHDPKAVEAIADFARLRQGQLGQLLQQLPPRVSRSDEQKKTYWNTKLSWLVALQGLALSANPSGKPLARELRDEFVGQLAGKPYREEFRRDLATELDPLLRVAPQSERPRSGTPAVTPAKTPKQTSQPVTEKPATMTPPEQTQPSGSVALWIVGAITAMILLSVLIWFLQKK